MASPARQFFDPGLQTAELGRSRSLRLLTRPDNPPAVAPPGPRPPDAARFTRRFAQLIAEVLAGARPARQLDDLTAPDVIRMLCRNHGRLAPQHGLAPVRPIVDSVHIREPCDYVVEACAVINLGVRKRAIAIRLEAAGNAWRCTALHVG